MTDPLDAHFGELRALLSHPLPALPRFTRPLHAASLTPWTHDLALPTWRAIFQLALSGRRLHKRRWDEQVLPYLAQQLDASWPDALRALPDARYRDVLSQRQGFTSPALSLVRALHLHQHSQRAAHAALTDGRLAHITHLALPCLHQGWSFGGPSKALQALKLARLPALTHLALHGPHTPADALCDALEGAQLPALTHLALSAPSRVGAAGASEQHWRRLHALPALAALQSLDLSATHHHTTLSEAATAHWITIVERAPHLRALSLRWTHPTAAQLARLADAPCFPRLDALDLVQRHAALTPLLKHPRSPSPRALALLHPVLDPLLASPLLDRVEELDLWLLDAARDLPRLANHPRWEHLTHLSLDLRAGSIQPLLDLPAPPALRTLRVAWPQRGYIQPAQLAQLARWSGLHPSSHPTRARAALLADVSPHVHPAA